MNRKRCGISRKYILLLALLLVLVIVSAVAIPLYAKYLKQTEGVKNTFSHVDTTGPTIDEKWENNVKEDVKVSVGKTDYPVYVRATIVITWKKPVQVDGKTEYIVYYQQPLENTDYELILSNDGSWIKDDEDGFYYYTKPVVSDGETSVLIERCVQLEGANVPEGYILSVEIIAQTVQAVGSTDVTGDPTAPGTPAYKDAWNLSSGNGDTGTDEGAEGDQQP